MSKRAALAMAAKLLEHARLAEPDRAARSYPFALSGGERQRAMIAMAIGCGPRLVIADEPTTALDVTVQAQILALIDGLRSQSKMALLLISHDLAVVAGHCSRVIVMYAGVVMESGPVEAVLRDPKNPYTLALLEARPRPGARRGARLTTIPGAPPVATAARAGCPFAGRCAWTIAICRTTPAPQVAFGADRLSRCHRAREMGPTR
jgi:oligopeptide/dipeptide ABC transporter ATP-binding protein